MIQDRLNDKEHDIRGVQKQSSELLSIAWQKGYQAGFDDGYATRREAEIIPQGEWILNKDENPECPFCHHSFTYFGNFCSNCGADLR